MGFIPKNARWYLADIVEEIRVEGEPKSLVALFRLSASDGTA
jgi:hypothetical protein